MSGKKWDPVSNSIFRIPNFGTRKMEKKSNRLIYNKLCLFNNFNFKFIQLF